MPISGILLACEPGRIEELHQQVDDREQSEVRQELSEALVVVTDTRSTAIDRQEVEQLRTLPGVLSAHVVFSNVEDSGGDHE